MTIKKSQNSGNYEVGYKKPPKNRQFGKKTGNKPGKGFWKKEDTARYKFQQIIQMTAEELTDLASAPDAGEYEKNIAKTILDLQRLDVIKRWQVLEGMIVQSSGYPKQQVEQKNIELQPILPKPPKREMGLVSRKEEK